jgi:hypothetical protein
MNLPKASLTATLLNSPGGQSSDLDVTRLQAGEIEIVDVFREPERALLDGIFMTPALVKLAPSPLRKIVGTLNQTSSVLEALGVENVAV